MAKAQSKDKLKSVDESGDGEGLPLSFEASMAGLQQIVSDLEDHSIGLEASLAQFERGIALLRNCYAFLERAEQKIEILTGFKANGEPVTAGFDATPTAGGTDTKTLF